MDHVKNRYILLVSRDTFLYMKNNTLCLCLPWQAECIMVMIVPFSVTLTAAVLSSIFYSHCLNFHNIFSRTHSLPLFASAWSCMLLFCCHYWELVVLTIEKKLKTQKKPTDKKTKISWN
jgi:lysylphosphatidylglycerol synthetase-like protein (DUF2156 family)